VAKKMTLWNYMADASIIFINKDFYDALTADEKTMYHNAAKEWAKLNIAEDTAYQKKAIEEMTKAGVEFYEMPAEGKVPFKALVEPLYKETEATAGAEDWAAFLKAVEDARK
jgi:TRAP-type C4-dicarboxylate transport system substrate-binding protein